MNICYYNWATITENKIRGGGVDIYQRNIINNIALKDGNVFFISSGLSYSPPFKKSFFIKKNNFITIYNSKTIAPAMFSFGSQEQNQEEDTENTFIEALTTLGHIDIIHFNNLEGIPVHILKKIKEKFAHIKIIFSMHNYYALCPQVDLFFADTENCTDFENGLRCLHCAKKKSNTLVKANYFITDFLSKHSINENSSTYDKATKATRKISQLIFKRKIKKEREILPYNLFSDRRNFFVDTINKYCDLVIPVSQRVEEIFISHGVRKEISKVIYIGTTHSKYFSKTKDRPFLKFNNQKMTICYLGYMRKSKGFHFLLDAFESIDKDIIKNINLVVAAKKNTQLFSRLEDISRSFNSFQYHDGYNHDNISEILKDVDVGLVPPIWEDNLPQVAIEMHCRHIPILTSNLGGASEIHNRNNHFTFEAGNVSSFKKKLEFLYNQAELIDFNYFNNSLPPISMAKHIEILKNEYERLIDKTHG